MSTDSLQSVESAALRHRAEKRLPQGISGLEPAEKLWKAKPSLKVIIMSGYSMKMVRNGTLANDAYTFLAKPFDLKTLSETVRHCLD